jgi:membrane protein implicated in regulation of membrane protease activity
MTLLQSFRSFFSIADPYHEPDPETAIKVFDLHEIAVVCYKLRPQQFGQVEYRGRYWSATCLGDLVLLPGTHVKVVDRVELILVVEPIAAVQSRVGLPKKRIEKTA